MSDLPHFYRVKSVGTATGTLISSGNNLPDITVAPPLQFGGPGDQWSPEDLLMAAVANCFVLSFRAISRASKLVWQSIDCEAVGTLDKVERDMLFTNVTTKVKLVIPAVESKERAEKILIKAEQACLITNSMSCDLQLECEVVFDGE
jgi:organic hydroperoxide reductase OsmC/OhrA